MAQKSGHDKSIDELRAEIARSRERVGRDLRGLHYELDFPGNLAHQESNERVLAFTRVHVSHNHLEGVPMIATVPDLPVKSHPLGHVDEYLEIGQKADASDVHLAVNAQPIWRVHGTLEPIWPDAPRLTSEQTAALAESFVP